MNTTIGIASLFFVVIFAAVAILIIALVIRWLFRINDIINLLDDIAETLKKNDLKARIRQYESKDLCDLCSKKWPLDKLKTIESGQSVCPNCLRNMSAK